MTIQIRLPAEFNFAVNSTFLNFFLIHDHCIAATIMRISEGMATMCSTISRQNVAVVMKHFR